MVNYVGDVVHEVFIVLKVHATIPKSKKGSQVNIQYKRFYDNERSKTKMFTYLQTIS